jgi:hypothetical protein
MADSVDRYRVIGVRADGSRAVLSVSLSREDAAWVKDALVEADIFPDVLIERDEREPPPPITPHRSALD